MLSNLFQKTVASVRLPILLNIIGTEYHLETHRISSKYLYVKLYNADLEYLPPLHSNILVFINLNLFGSGVFELKGSIDSVEDLTGGRKGIWIEYETKSETDSKKINEFIKKFYIPRYSTRFDIEILSENDFFNAEAINLSENGIFIESKLYSIKEREVCILTLYPEKESIQIHAEVSWINSGLIHDKPIGYGFKFIHTGLSKYRIKKFVKKLKMNSEILR